MPRLGRGLPAGPHTQSLATRAPAPITWTGDAAVDTTATITADGFVTTSTGAAAAATATVTAAGFVTTATGATVTATVTPTAAGTTVLGGAAAVTVTATITAVGVGSWGPPPNIIATPISGTQVDLSWDAVPTATGYRIWRDGAVIAANQAGTSYSDLTVVGSTAYSYELASIR